MIQIPLGIREELCILMGKLHRRSLVVSAAIVSIASCAIAIYSIHSRLSTVPTLPAAELGVKRDSPRVFRTSLSTAEKEHILDGQFTVVASTAAMPPPLKHAFAVITGQSHFALADPGDKYQATDVVYDHGDLPFRRLVFAGVTGNKWFIHYEHGGIGHSYAVVVFETTPENRVKFIWGGAGSQAATSVEDLRKAISNGRFRDDGDYLW